MAMNLNEKVFMKSIKVSHFVCEEILFLLQIRKKAVLKPFTSPYLFFMKFES